MKIVIMSFLLLSTLFGAAKVVHVDEKFQRSQSCKACHMRIVQEWEHSWHSKSHYKHDEYFRKSLDYVARKTRKSINSVKVQCATCHNPRISVTSTGEDYEMDALMGLDKGSKIDKAVNDDSISEGINCVVCHHIDKIHNEYDASKRGINRVEWTKSGTMTGPYKDAKSPYHKTVHHAFMDKKPNDLCLVCHANDRSARGLVFTNMQSEYKKGSKSCVECHMGPRQKDVAATYKMYNGKAKIRDVRNHSFSGGHTSLMWINALDLELKEKKDALYITIKNPQPHNIPSGFGSREVVVNIIYKKGTKIIDEKNIFLTTHYKRKSNKISIAHLAKSASKDLSIPAKGKKVLKVAKVQDATSVEVELNYVLVNKEVRTLLGLKDRNWSRKNYITRKILELKK